MKDIQELKSDLKLEHFYFSHCSIERGRTVKTGDVRMFLSKEIKEVSIHAYEVILSLFATKEDLKMQIVANGMFTVKADVADEDELIQHNAVAIMFPYIRSQATLLTSQPGMKPIVIPIVNTNKI